ncbi:MAG: HDOD domain-containing protein [Syntrophales bacterium]
MGTIRKDLLEIVEKMPAFPRSVHRVIELTSDINSNPKELVEVIEHDPILIMKILKLVNSAYFGLAYKITSVNHAVVYVGINTVKNLALSAATLGVLPRTNNAGFDTNAFLLHSLSTAIIAKIFARKLKTPEREEFDFFLSGLLHDFGKIVFARYMPREFRQVLQMVKENGLPLSEAEKQIFATDHAQIGSVLGEKWNLPSHVIACIRDHHCHDREGSMIMDAVSAADQISKELRIGFGGERMIDKLPERILERFGTDMQSVINSLGNINAETEKALIFIQK